MEKFFNLLTLDNITEGVKKAYIKYDRANSNFWVTSLSFYTIVGLAPISAILFSLGNWFGAKEYLINQLVESTPLPKEIIELISKFAENLLKSARSGVLAGLGFLFLGWTFIKMFSLIENSFNDIWHISSPRTFIRKVSDYIAFFIFLPLVIIILNGALIIVINKIEGLSILYQILSKTVPYISLLTFLTLLYVVMPNTTVKVVPATVSAFVISILFSVFQFIFINLQLFISSYNVIYGSFSVIFIFLMWIRIFWFFIILGVHMTYLLQNGNFDINLESTYANISFNSKLYVSFRILEELIKRYLENDKIVSYEELKKSINSSSFLLESMLNELIKNEYIICGTNLKNEKIYSIAKNIDETILKEVYELIAKSGEEIYLLRNNTIDNVEKIILDKDYDRTLRSLGGK